MRLKRWKQLLTLLAVACLLLPFASTGAEGGAEIPTAKGTEPATVRVLLTRFSAFDRLDMTLNGSYSADYGTGSLVFGRGADVTVLLKNGRFYLYYMDTRLDAGTELVFSRHPVEAGTLNGVQFANNPSLYEGDLRLTVVDEKLNMVLTLGLEDYVKGVVPYEMSESFPLEALKAQAVAARTYVVSKALTAVKNAYDVVDNTNDQVYRGRREEYTRCEQAVNDTRGVCGFYKGKLATCYYTASNGGQTELAENEWKNVKNAGYLDMRDDPYDLANPQSRVLSVTVPKTAATVKDMPYAIRLLVSSELAGELVGQGFDPAPESVLVNAVTAISVNTPRFEAPSRLYTMLHITFEYSARTRTDPPIPATGDATDTPQPSASPIADEDTTTPAPPAEDEEVSLFTAAVTPSPAPTATPEPTAEPTPEPASVDTVAEDTATVSPAPTPSPSPTPAPSYGPFVKTDQPVTLDIPIFPDAEKYLSLSINGDDNELYTVTEDDTSFTISARRFGHGVGLSQRGAEWMAGNDQKTYTEILSFYYPGMTLMRYAETAVTLPPLEQPLTETAGPVPTPTPRPTLMPVTQTLPTGAWYATVTGIAEDSTLNLRATPDLSGDVLMKLYRDQKLIVVEECDQEGWVRVKTDAVEGYVMEKFLTKAN
jgi:hypothetical protein